MAEGQEQQLQHGDQNEDGSVVVLTESPVDAGDVESVEEIAEKPAPDRVGPGGFYKEYEDAAGNPVEVLVLPTGEAESEGAGGPAEATGPAKDPDVATGETGEGEGGETEPEEGFAPGDAPA